MLRRAESSRLPPIVIRPCRAYCTYEAADAGPRLNDALSDKASQRPLHRHRADLELRDQLSGGGKLRTGERPARSFWIAAALGAIAAVVFAVIQGAGFSGLQASDMLLFAAVIVRAIGYAEGGLLSRTLGSWQTISWALALASPLMVLLTGVAIAQHPPTGTLVEWGAFAYLAAVSMFLGFFAWYRGLAIGPMAQVSQVQLTQPVMSTLWAGLLLGEYIGWQTIVGCLAVISCALLEVRARNRGEQSRRR